MVHRFLSLLFESIGSIKDPPSPVRTSFVSRDSVLCRPSPICRLSVGRSLRCLYIAEEYTVRRPYIVVRNDVNKAILLLQFRFVVRTTNTVFGAQSRKEKKKTLETEMRKGTGGKFQNKKGPDERRVLQLQRQTPQLFLTLVAVFRTCNQRMSKKQWMVLLMLFLTYLLLGASIFYHIESRLEIERVEKAKRERIEINALLRAHYVPSLSHDHDEIFEKLTQYCGKSVYNYTENETDPLKWDFYNSFYFAYTVVSTIGYGNLAPTNMLGRILMIFYGLIGIPMNGILLTQLGEFFGHVFVKAHQKYKSYKHGSNNYYSRKLTTFETGKVGLAAQIFAHLTPGFVMFIFFPAFLFSHYEGWTYDEAVYYAFVTLTTIGFGDYVAGQDNSKGSGISFILYKTFLICWISFGLGYTVMIMTFIARGMRSKKITRIEHKLAVNLKHTQSKIWNEFNKEINYLRRVFNELQLSKVKRVYVDECNYETPPSKFLRSTSFPDLRDLLYGSKEKDGVCCRPRRRANSEVVPTEDQVARVVSETDLQRIDKTATFATHAMVQPAELLARLVNILGYIPPATEDIGGDGSNQTTFIGQDVGGRGGIEESNSGKKLAEKASTTFSSNPEPGIWTIGHERIPCFPRLRSRATSEVGLYETKNEERNVEHTWSGPIAIRKIQESMKARTSESSSRDRGIKESRFSKLRSLSLAKSVPKALISSGPWKGRFSTSSERKGSGFEQDGSKKDVEQSFAQGSTSIDDRRDSILRRHYYTHTGVGNNLSTEGANNLLEETSLADFLRAITVLHASVATSGSWTAAPDDGQMRQSQPRRKMGTASLTPPKLPSLFTLFSPSPSPLSTSQSNNQNVVTQQSNVNWSDTKPETRRESSLAFVTPKVVKSRRFSLRPVATPVSPPTPPKSGSPLLSDSRRAHSENRPTFLFESPREPLIRTEGAQGLSSPVKAPLNGRRFSLRSTQNQNGISSGNNGGVVATLKSLPRWKAGMLQRQIGQMNLRRRVRAFSLSDVYTEDPEEKTEPFDLSSNIYKKNNRDTPCKRISLSLRGDSNDDKPTKFIAPSYLPEQRYPLSSREAVPLKSVRVDEKNVQIIEPRAHSTGNAISYNATDRSNEPVTPCSWSKDDDAVKIIGSSLSENFYMGATNWTFSSELDRTDSNHECSPFIAAHTDSQQSLVEVKVENPATNTVQNPLPTNGSDDSRNSLTDATESNITKAELNSSTSKS